MTMSDEIRERADAVLKLKLAKAAETAANAFDRFVCLLERVETFALARWEEEKAKKADDLLNRYVKEPLGRRKVADR
jgi:hypothetical protein